MTKIEYVSSNDKDFWYSLDKHLPEKNLKIRLPISKATYFLQMTGRLDFCAIICFGTTHLFALCFL